MNIETSIIKENGTTITVIDTYANMKMYVPKENVQRILDKIPNADPKKIALILATIEKSRIAMNPEREVTVASGVYKGMPRVKEHDLCEGLICLLREYDAENLSEIFEDLKYFEICNVLKSYAPNSSLRKYL